MVTTLLRPYICRSSRCTSERRLFACSAGLISCRQAMARLGGRLALGVQYIEITRHIIESISNKYGVVLTGSADPDPSIITMPFKAKGTEGNPVGNPSPAQSSDRAGSAAAPSGAAPVLGATLSRSSSVPFSAQVPQATTVIPSDPFGASDLPSAAYHHPSLGPHPGRLPPSNSGAEARPGSYAAPSATHLPQVYVPSSLEVPPQYVAGAVGGGLPPNGVHPDQDESSEFAAWSTADGIQEYRRFEDLNMINLAMRPS